MASIGSLYTSAWTASGGEAIRLRLDLDATDNYSANTSTVTWSLNLDRAKKNGHVDCGGFKVVINGTVVYQTSTDTRVHISPNDNPIAKSGESKPGILHNSVVIPHNADGSKSFSAYVEGSIYYYGTNSTGSKTFTLSNIPRKANITSATNLSDNSYATIYYSNPAGNALKSLTFGIDDNNNHTIVSYEISVNKTGTSFKFDATNSANRYYLNQLYAKCSSGNTMTIRYVLKSVIGSDTYYSVSNPHTFTITDPNPSMNPVIEDTNSRTNSKTNSKDVAILGFSNMKITVNATGRKGATINNNATHIFADGVTKYGASSTFNAFSSTSYTCSIVDSRGNATTKSYNVKTIPYVQLTCGIESDVSFQEDRGQTASIATAHITISGRYYAGSFGRESNTLILKYRRDNGDNVFQNDIIVPMSKITIQNNRYSYSFDVPNLDYNKKYKFEAWAQDKLDATDRFPKTIEMAPLFYVTNKDFVLNALLDLRQGYAVTNAIDLENQSNETLFNDRLDRFVDDMTDGTSKFIKFSIYPVISGNEYFGVLTRSWTNQYAILIAVSYNKELIFKYKAGSTWTNSYKINIDNTIESQGISGIWHYRKWRNQTVELWTRYNYNFSTPNGTVNGMHKYNITLPYPFKFKNYPVVNGSIGVSGFLDVPWASDALETAHIEIVTFYNYTTSNSAGINIHVIGEI